MGPGADHPEGPGCRHLRPGRRRQKPCFLFGRAVVWNRNKPVKCEPPLQRGPSAGTPATGTVAGYRRHRRAAEPACSACSPANRLYERRRRGAEQVPAAQFPPQFPAAERTVAELRRQGRLEPVDAALVAAFLGLAEAVDASPWTAPLWRQYREAAEALRQVGATDSRDPVRALLTQLDDAGEKGGSPRRRGDGIPCNVEQMPRTVGDGCVQVVEDDFAQLWTGVLYVGGGAVPTYSAGPWLKSWHCIGVGIDVEHTPSPRHREHRPTHHNQALRPSLRRINLLIWQIGARCHRRAGLDSPRSRDGCGSCRHLVGRRVRAGVEQDPDPSRDSNDRDNHGQQQARATESSHQSL